MLPLPQILLASGTGADWEHETLDAKNPVKAHYFQCWQVSRRVKVMDYNLECVALLYIPPPPPTTT